MCRFLAYKGAPLLMHKLLYDPYNSLIHQSYHALERKDPVNGDGFGLGWYAPDIDPEPALFVSILPAWSNRNLRYLASKIRSGCFMAHVRAAGFGTVSEANCHPFHYGRLLMMHNGDIGEFATIRRKLRYRLSDEAYNWITGETDSEHFFALFLNFLLDSKSSGYEETDVVEALLSAIAELREILDQHQVEIPVSLNLAITDGNFLVATRYDSDPDSEPPTLYYSSESRFVCREGVGKLVQTDTAKHGILIASEKLTEDLEVWHRIPPNQLIVVGEDLSVSLADIPV